MNNNPVSATQFTPDTDGPPDPELWIIEVVDAVRECWQDAGFDITEIDEIPTYLEPLQSELDLGIRLSYAQFAAAVAATLSIECGPEDPTQVVAEAPELVFALRRWGFDPEFGVREWAQWGDHK